MFATMKTCFEVGRDGTPNVAAYRIERESGSLQGQFDAGMPCGDRGRPLADRKLYRKRKVSIVSHHLCQNQPGTGDKPKPPFGRVAPAQCRAHRAHQKGIGSQAKYPEKDLAQEKGLKLFAKAGKRNKTLAGFRKGN